MIDKIDIKSLKWIDAVESIDECVLCGSRNMLQIAHRNMGKGRKSPDWETARICDKCHSEICYERTELIHRAIVRTHSMLLQSRAALSILGVYLP